MQIGKYVFTAALFIISRVTQARDLVLGRIGPLANRRGARLWSGHSFALEKVPCSIKSGQNTLDACFVSPTYGLESGPVRAGMLICHGIGETVEHWLPVQRLLASEGVASLVFDYSGYGRSTGRIGAAQCDADAIAAFAYLKALMPEQSLALLGFSLGSGIAAAVIRRVDAHQLILCAAFTSFRAAAQSLGFPELLALTFPNLWRADENLHDCPVPVLIVHGGRDELFPLPMAQQLASYCESELVIVPETTHNQPFYAPDIAYWGLILSRLTGQTHAT